MSTLQHYEKLSRSLSWLLRHGAVKKGLTVSSDGYIEWNDIRKLSQFSKYNLDDVKYVVRSNDKQRFGLKEENKMWYIRANQGHSNEVGSKVIQDELLIQLHEPLGLIIHNTTYEKYNEINQNGFKKTRMHIQFSMITKESLEQYDTISKRPIRIFLDMKQAMDDGIEFYVSQNQLILSPGIGDEGQIDRKYINKVINRETGQEID